jgi:hypothetical protein
VVFIAILLVHLAMPEVQLFAVALPFGIVGGLLAMAYRLRRQYGVSYELQSRGQCFASAVTYSSGTWRCRTVHTRSRAPLEVGDRDIEILIPILAALGAAHIAVTVGGALHMPMVSQVEQAQQRLASHGALH